MLDLGPALDSDQGRFVLPQMPLLMRRRQQALEAPQLSLLPVQAVTAPTGWALYQEAKKRLAQHLAGPASRSPAVGASMATTTLERPRPTGKTSSV